ncbi:Xylose isomerase domain protein TIM barrel [Denitrovibrio acetiphilus DSM 12809]|uniref:Xylose isomerase domain protein TIM barrel n=1 Tax=Denitrovibrio acetiphilus (strain DSM 12809 / NBRC 114555 / N2460) TaxID=522772 RepID=D4H1Y0_DENA2|nr:cobamide remodeling phosphodiesterase CbiR [Denitrovibrio acetiphilus]ADD66957.1 Xylose isomerase domain protein TIM barrel [Denitrovibrio acetiphilus DSM 12809]
MKFISAPSFIKPATRIENVRYLKGLIDEVELLYMCSMSDYDFPDVREVSELADIDIRYNIHMPYDRDLSKQSEWDFMARFADVLGPLGAHTHTFHIQPEDNFFKGLEWFVGQTGLPVTLENGGSDIESFRLSDDDICLDVGHMVMFEQDISAFIECYAERIKMFHLHGVCDGKDHQSIRHLPEDIRKLVFAFADKHSLTVSLEVFNEADLKDSLLFLDYRS